GGDRVLDLGDLAGTVTDLLTDAAAFAAARAQVAAADPAALPALDAAAFVAPVTPSKILCLGYNYRGHVPDGVDPTANDPEYPDVFVKTP
ncbi:hypothetical protein ACJBRJ_10985, partial [Streptococcus suis]